MTEAIEEKQVIDSELEEMFDKVDHCIDTCEEDNNLDKAEALLKENLESVSNPADQSRIYAMLAHVEFWRYDYAEEDSKERTAIAKKGADLAKKALELDDTNVYSNAWAAAMLGIHGQEEGILSILHYLPKIEGYAKRAVELDPRYNNAMGHQVLGNLYRLSPPKPIGIGSKKKSHEHLSRARELAPTCPVAALSLAELQLARRKKGEAKEAIDFVLDFDIVEHGPIFASRQKDKARELQARL
jgi:tetratricopeptide (TPR) repeat protein